jgi:lysophospholipase L1-like esterase
MIENVCVYPSSLKKVTFVVNVRTPSIKGGSEVRLKDREKTTEIWAWDEKLTLEFNGGHPILCALEITRVDVPTVFLLGDSTVCDQPREPYNSWGQMLTRFVKPEIAVANHAESGESIKSSLAARRFDKVFSEMRPGDYLFLQFGHNDQKEKGEGVGAMTTYKKDLEMIVAKTRELKGIPVLLTSMHRRNFDPRGKIVNTLGEYPNAVRLIAREMNVPLIDLNNMSAALYEALGVEGSAIAFKSGDGTHHNNYGSYQLAKCVIEGIRSLHSALASKIQDGVTSYNPARPDPASKFDIPPSPLTAAEKPAGN